MSQPVEERPLIVEDLVYRSLLSPAVYRGDDVLDGEDVVPGFRVRVAALFED